jgi:hypothetical protein
MSAVSVRRQRSGPPASHDGEGRSKFTAIVFTIKPPRNAALAVFICIARPGERGVRLEVWARGEGPICSAVFIDDVHRQLPLEAAHHGAPVFFALIAVPAIVFINISLQGVN